MSVTGPFVFSVEKTDFNQRLDVIVASRLSECSRSFAAALIRNGSIRVNRTAVKPGYRLKPGDIVGGSIPPPKPVTFGPENIPLEFLYEDGELAVINKPAGMVVHPAPGNYTGTVVNAMLFHCPDLGNIGGDIRPGIVHRLDKDTSGAMVVAKNGTAHNFLTRQFKERSIKKEYLAIVHGNMKADAGRICLPIGRHPTQRKKMSTVGSAGRRAETLWQIKERYAGVTLLRLDLKTGRTHQIRVHCSAIQHPVVGDALYGGRRNISAAGIAADKVRHLIAGVKRQMLHARRLQFVHPTTRKSLTFEAPVPEDMRSLMADLATYSNIP